MEAAFRESEYKHDGVHHIVAWVACVRTDPNRGSCLTVSSTNNTKVTRVESSRLGLVQSNCLLFISSVRAVVPVDASDRVFFWFRDSALSIH